MDLVFFVYILASQRYGTLYVGVTDDLPRRVAEHRQGVVPGFTRTYAVHRLVWFEATDSREGALVRERQLKRWNRAWKISLIEASNPDWVDLGRNLPPV